MTMGFVGLGQMGRPMALNLLKKSGERLIVHSAHPAGHAEFEGLGATVASRVAELEGAQVVFLCLPDGAVVQDVLFGRGALAQHLQPGALVVDTSTIGHGMTLEIGRMLAARGLRFVDAPVSGMAARASDGTLTIMCGGERADFERAEPSLRCMGTQVLHMGPAGSGQLAKLVNQLLFDIHCAALAEILPMAAKMGLEPSKVGAVINSGTGRSYASEFFVPRILRGHFGDGYPLQHAYKDLVSAAELGARCCIPMPVLAAATATYQTALLAGHGALDKGAMVLPAEQRLDIRFREAA